METSRKGKMSPKSSESEWLRGLKESAAGIEVLRSLWPNAFPQQRHLVRPLVTGVAGQIAERMGWSHQYTTGVLRGWKLRRAYCEAVLRYDHRFSLDGEEVAEAVVEDGAREQARRQLARLAARRVKDSKERLKRHAPEQADGDRAQAERVNSTRK
jgi:sRNA-binding protein